MNGDMDLTIVVPCLNEEKNIANEAAFFRVYKKGNQPAN